eukprot:gnl/MRDRNA2_/MRDRNA2_16351_c0_seq1.p2 gnl/MRDRNA2_/MRDRNA2_16351_c0~~gnl/MRDRNA2_/MRDRNA2_16351_c0_seq1.p2  ORF type:complete len:111 (+),score=11.61 gnl/MRDRNA2_/MRDRNA2_16351_c0_seq1:408-740(+)
MLQMAFAHATIGEAVPSYSCYFEHSYFSMITFECISEVQTKGIELPGTSSLIKSRVVSEQHDFPKKQFSIEEHRKPKIADPNLRSAGCYRTSVLGSFSHVVPGFACRPDS